VASRPFSFVVLSSLSLCPSALKKSISLLSSLKSPYFKMTLLVRSTLAGVQFDMGTSRLICVSLPSPTVNWFLSVGSKEDATVAWAGIMTDLRKHYGVAKELTAVFLPYSRLVRVFSRCPPRLLCVCLSICVSRSLSLSLSLFASLSLSISLSLSRSFSLSRTAGISRK
jgi:hypothetical protein